MNKTTKNKSQRENSANQRVFWGTITLAGVELLLSGYTVISSLKPGMSMGSYINLAVMFVMAGSSIASIMLAMRHHEETGFSLAYSIILIMSLGSVLSSQGQAMSLSTFILIVALLTIRWLSPQLRRVFSIATAITLVMMWVTEAINPSWRFAVSTGSTQVEFIFGILFAIIIGVYLFRQAMQGQLRTKLIGAFLGVTIVPLVIISILTYFSTNNALTNEANQKLANAAASAAQDIDTFIDFNLQTVRTAGLNPAVLDYLVLPAGQRAGSAEEARALKFIAAISRQDPVFISSVAIFSTKGVTLLDTSPADIGLDKSSREYFKNTMQTGLPYASDVEFSSTTGVPSLYFAAPARDASGKVIGVIRIRYFASILQKLIIADTGLAGESSYGVLLDVNHVRLAHGTDRARIFKSIVPLDVELVKQLQATGLLGSGTPQELSTDLPDFEKGLNNIQQEPFFSADTNADGALERVALSPLKTKNWSLAFIQTESVFLAGSRAQTNNNLLTTFIVSLIVGVIGFLFSQFFSGPIIRLTQVAEAIAGGDINIQAKVETSDEIGILAGTFNRMTQQLRDFIVNLEERVVARTKDLETVAEVGTATATILDTNQLLQAVVDLTKERFNLYHSHIYLLDEAGENLVLARGAGEAGRQMKEKGLSIPLNRAQSLVARAAREQKGVTVNDVTQAPDFLPNPLLPDTRSELAVPMIVGGKVIGVFDVQSDKVGRFTDSDINIQTTLAAQVATSIQNVRSFEQSKSQADLESLVNSIGQKIQRSSSVEETLQTAIRELGLALGASRVSANIQSNSQGKGWSGGEIK